MKYPERIQKAIQRAEIHLAQGQADAALLDMEAATKKYPKGFHPWSLLGRAKSLLGDQAGAELAHRNALRILPNDAASWFNLGVTFSSREMYAEAAPCYEKALRNAKTSYFLDAACNLGICELRLKRYVEAQATFREILRFGGNPRVLAMLGLALHGARDFPNAIEVLEKAAALGMDGNLELQRTLESAYLETGDADRATTCRQRAQALEGAASTTP
jgi:tetratricopeptide (TPR) repeat protein